MSIDVWWPQLRAETQRWLMENNGDAVPSLLIAEIQAAGGPSETDPWWAEQDSSASRCMPDEATDWIEQKANNEESSG